MKNLGLIALLVGLMLTSCQPKQLSLSVELEGLLNKEVTIFKMEGRERVELVKGNATDGVFKTELELEYPDLYILSIDNRNLPLFLENANITISGNVMDIENATVEGSKSNGIFNTYKDLMKPYQEENQRLMQEYRAVASKGNQDSIQAIVSEYETLMDKRSNDVKTFIKENGNSAVAAFIVMENFRYESDLEKVNEVFSLLSTSLKGMKPYDEMLERIQKLESVAVGAMAPDFEMADTTGTMMKLSDLKGKYILMDFWASWCGPCRRENPNVVALYEKYKTEAFDIIGISLDRERAPWLQAIKDDNLTWNHVSDVKGWDCAAAKLYAVSGIPHTILLDKEGKIIAKNLRGEELEAKLVELFGAK